MSADRPLKYVTALRGVACAGVVLHHSFLEFPWPAGIEHLPMQLLLRISRVGWLGVSLFLVLSGFCLYYPLVARAGQAREFDLGAFARRRMWRILPPYYVALLLFVGIELLLIRQQKGYWDWWGSLHSPADALLHLTMLHNLSPASIGTVNPSFWSLALECQLYVVFPVLLWLAARHGLKRMLIATALVALAWQTACFLMLGFSAQWPTNFAVYYHALPGRCFEFAAGMVAARLVARPVAGQSRVALLLILVLVGPALYFVLQVSRFGPLIDQAWGILFASLVVLLSRAPALPFERNPLLRFFVWLGAISYSVYLLHQPLIWFISLPVLHMPQTELGNYAGALLRMALIVGLGYLYYLCVERPFLQQRPPVLRQSAEIRPA